MQNAQAQEVLTRIRWTETASLAALRRAAAEARAMGDAATKQELEEGAEECIARIEALNLALDAIAERRQG